MEIREDRKVSLNDSQIGFIISVSQIVVKYISLNWVRKGVN